MEENKVNGHSARTTELDDQGTERVQSPTGPVRATPEFNRV